MKRITVKYSESCLCHYLGDNPILLLNSWISRIWRIMVDIVQWKIIINWYLIKTCWSRITKLETSELKWHPNISRFLFLYKDTFNVSGIAFIQPNWTMLWIWKYLIYLPSRSLGHGIEWVYFGCGGCSSSIKGIRLDNITLILSLT